MGSAGFLCGLICMHILSFACAAPPIRPDAFNGITLIAPSINSTESQFAAYVEIRRSMTLTDAEFRFPPLLPDPFTYHGRGADYEYEIIFSRTMLYRGLNATQIDICMRKAILMASNRASRDPDFPFPEMSIKIYGGTAPGDVMFQIHNQLPSHALTWGNWVEVLVGFEGFTKAYPGVGFIFHVKDSSGMPLYGAMYGNRIEHGTA